MTISFEEALKAAAWAARVGLPLPPQYAAVLVEEIANLNETIAILSDSFTMEALAEATSE